MIITIMKISTMIADQSCNQPSLAMPSLVEDDYIYIYIYI